MDEDSITGLPFLGWFKYGLEPFRKMKFKVDDDFNIQNLLHEKHTKLSIHIVDRILAFKATGGTN